MQNTNHNSFHWVGFFLILSPSSTQSFKSQNLVVECKVETVSGNFWCIGLIELCFLFLINLFYIVSNQCPLCERLYKSIFAGDCKHSSAKFSNNFTIWWPSTTQQWTSCVFWALGQRFRIFLWVGFSVSCLYWTLRLFTCFCQKAWRQFSQKMGPQCKNECQRRVSQAFGR